MDDAVKVCDIITPYVLAKESDKQKVFEILDIKEKLEKDLSVGVSVEQLAATIGISKYYMCHIFKKTTVSIRYGSIIPQFYDRCKGIFQRNQKRKKFKRNFFSGRLEFFLPFSEQSASKKPADKSDIISPCHAEYYHLLQQQNREREIPFQRKNLHPM